MAPTINRHHHNASPTSSSSWLLHRMQAKLEERKRTQTLRTLTTETNNDSAIDFSSNDYLGLAQDAEQQQLVLERHDDCCEPHRLGATGSRLLSGNSDDFEQLEHYLASIHQRPSALLFNSGYDANLSVVSSLPVDCILYDEYSHNSLIMGARLWSTAHKGLVRSFRHNDVLDLKRQLKECQPQKAAILVESVYSMDGDVAPLQDVLTVAAQFDAQLVVDEAHGLGVMGGTGLINSLKLQSHPNLLYTVYTFGKAAGCHGAVVSLPNPLTRSYLINYAYPFIYSTSLPPHSLVTIRCAYETLTSTKGDMRRTTLQHHVQLFRSLLAPLLQQYAGHNIRLLESTSPIQALMVPGNDRCTRFCQLVYEKSEATIRLYPIKSPTVPKTQERVRMVLHAHNTALQIHALVQFIGQALRELLPLAKL